MAPTVKIWNQKPQPLVASVFHLGNARAGKSRLFSVCEEIFDTCDDVIGEHVHTMLREGSPVTLQSITLQSFPSTEIICRCSSSFPLVAFPEGDERVTNFKQSEVWGGRAFNLDEALRILGRPRPPSPAAAAEVMGIVRRRCTRPR